MGFTEKAGWSELQRYRAALANIWLWTRGCELQQPMLLRFHVWYEARGHTSESGADFFISLGDMSNNAPDDARTAYPISCPSRRDGRFNFRRRGYAQRLRRAAQCYKADDPDMMAEWRRQANRDIAVYQAGHGTRLGTGGWLRDEIHKARAADYDDSVPNIDNALLRSVLLIGQTVRVADDHEYLPAQGLECKVLRLDEDIPELLVLATPTLATYPYTCWDGPGKEMLCWAKDVTVV